MLPAILGAAATLGGALLGGRNKNKGADQQYALIQSELRRRNQIQDYAMPTVLRALGFPRTHMQMPAPYVGGGGSFRPTMLGPQGTLTRKIGIR